MIVCLCNTETILFIKYKNMSKPQGTPPCQHTIEAGDTFSNLALAYYKDGSDVNANKIAGANPGVEPTKLQIGQVISIP